MTADSTADSTARSMPDSAADSTADSTGASTADSNLRDIADVPALDVWGETVQARVIVGNNASLAVVELDPNAIVPEHHHVQEQLGLCIKGSITFTIDGERRALGAGGTWRIPSNAVHDGVAGPDGAIVVDIFSPVRSDWDALPRSAPRAPRWPERDDTEGDAISD